MRWLLRLFAWLCAAVGLCAWTWLWFCPVGGFHHMIRCGLLGCAILDGENGEPAVRWSGPVLLISGLAWHLGVAAIAAVVYAVAFHRRRAAALLLVAEDVPEPGR